jgi:hypothetical protein
MPLLLDKKIALARDTLIWIIRTRTELPPRRRDRLRRLLIAAAVCSPLIRCLLYLWRPDNPYLQYVLLPTHCEESLGVR